jgi:hypothetical protein
MHDKWGGRLRTLGMLPGHWDGCHAGTPDGAYYFFGCDAKAKDFNDGMRGEIAHKEVGDRFGRDIQLVIVGPMKFSPLEYVQMINGGYWVKSVCVMPPGPSMPAALWQIILERGMMSVLLRHALDEQRPSFYAPFEKGDASGANIASFKSKN